MSKNIWHTADEAPRYRFQCVYYHRNGKDYYFGEYDSTFKVFMGKKTFHQDEAWKFAFAEDVIACLDELERTRKALDVAVDALKEINDRYESEEQRGREEDDSPDWWDFSMDTGEILAKAIEQITALEQKDVK